MNPNMILAIGYLITTALEAGLTITDVLTRVRATGVIPDDEWDRVEQDIKSGVEFWSA